MMRRGEEFQPRGEPSSQSSILGRDFGDGPSAPGTLPIDAAHPRNNQAASTEGLHCSSNARLETKPEVDRDPPTFARDGDASSQSSKVCHEHLRRVVVDEESSSPWPIDDREEPPGYRRGEMAYKETTIDEERCPAPNCEDREDQPCDERDEPECDERRSDNQSNYCQHYHEEAREAIPNEFVPDHEEMECHLLMLQQRDEEEETMQREREEMIRRNEEVRVIAVLDELLRIHEEEYPVVQDGEVGAAQQEVVDMVELGDADKAGDDLDRLLFLEGTSLSNDAQIEELVAICDRRDRNIEIRTPAAASASSGCSNDDEDFPESAMIRRDAACVVCLDAPRTHAYVPCGHFCVCFSCAKQQAKSASKYSSCPVCQQPSTRVMKIFIP